MKFVVKLIFLGYFILPLSSGLYKKGTFSFIQSDEFYKFIISHLGRTLFLGRARNKQKTGHLGRVARTKHVL
jgi:hypothetical protein